MTRTNKETAATRPIGADLDALAQLVAQGRPHSFGYKGEMTDATNLNRKLDLFDEHWQPKILIVDLRLDVAQVSRILGDARPSLTLDTYTHLFDRAAHAADIRERMAKSEFGCLLTETPTGGPAVAALRLLPTSPRP